MKKTTERKRLDSLKDTSRNVAKTYKFPVAALKLIEKAGRIHTQKSRAIQVAAELLWYNAVEYISDEEMQPFRDTPLVLKTYKLPERTVKLIDAMAPSFGTLGNVMIAIAITLKRTENVDTRPPDIGKGPMTAEQKRETRKALRETFGRLKSD
jgi:hypothetical protein